MCIVVLAQEAGPPTVVCCTICVLQSEMSHMLCISDSYEGKKKKHILPGSTLGKFSFSPHYFACQKETHQQQAFQPKL